MKRVTRKNKTRECLKSAKRKKKPLKGKEGVPRQEKNKTQESREKLEWTRREMLEKRKTKEDENDSE